jgi:uridine kinase
MSQAGGNVHYERFLETVIKPSINEQSVNYQSYDCAHQTLGSSIVYEPKKWIVVEGAYALHPELSAYYDYKIFVTHSANRQKERILRRNGEQKLFEFELRWIPLEEKYILEKKPEANCDMYIDTSNAW